MKLSVLIHCRTFGFDFNSEFLARPSDFTSDDIKWAREHILPSTAYCDELEGKRFLLFNNNKYCVLGIVSLLDDALRRFGFNEQEILKYSFDENKRKIKCFVGFVFHVSDKDRGYVPAIKDDNYYKLLEKYIANEKVFFSKSQSCIKVDYCTECDLIAVSTIETLDECIISSDKNDEEMFTKLIANITASNTISFCSNVYNLKMIEDGKFNYFTANQNTIQRYKIKKAENDNKANELATQAEPKGIKNKDDVKKKGVLKVVFVIAAVLLLVAIILGILL